MSRTLVLSFALVSGAALCFGQGGALNGEITGTVTDPSGATVTNADVQAVNTGTGYKQSVKTGDTGIYRLTLLPLGIYEINIQAQGFAPTKRTAIELNAGAIVTVDVSLSVAG